jgi:hypothetical protein
MKGRMIAHSNQMWIPQMGYISQHERVHSPHVELGATSMAPAQGENGMDPQKETVAAIAAAVTKGASMNTQKKTIAARNSGGIRNSVRACG